METRQMWGWVCKKFVAVEVGDAPEYLEVLNKVHE